MAKGNKGTTNNPPRTGGGVGSRQHNKTPVRVGKPANGINPGAVSYLGNQLGDHSMSGDMKLKTTPWKGPASTNASQKLGNEVALNGSGSGARPGGGGRVVRPTGSQGQQGPSILELVRRHSSPAAALVVRLDLDFLMEGKSDGP